MECTVIQTADDPTKGYVWIDVPASATAPHMVDGVYYGRGDKTRIRLSDPEVRRLHERQALSAAVIKELLDEYVARDPVPDGLRQQAHLYVVAAPVGPRREMLLDAVSGPERYEILHRLVSTGARASQLGDRFSPSIESATTFARRSDGAAMTTGAITPERLLEVRNRYTESFLEIEVSDEGIVRVMTGRFSDDLNGHKVLFETMFTSLVRQTIDIAAKVAVHSSYGGGWMLGVKATGIAGLPAHLNGKSSDLGETRVGADQNEYAMTTSASTTEMKTAPWDVTQRLSGRFVRSLGIQEMPEVKAASNPPSATTS